MTVAYETVDMKIARAIKTIRLAVTTAGTAERISPVHLPVLEVVITADHGNTGNAAVGDSAVDASTSEQGPLMGPGEVATFQDLDLFDKWADVTVNGEAVSAYILEMP